MFIKLLLTLFFITASQAASTKKYFLVEGCNVFPQQGPPVLILPGKFCQFYEDGSFISATSSSIRRFDKKQTLLWEKKMHIHHQVNLSVDKRSILTLSSEIKSIAGKLVRVDQLIKMDLNGQILNTVSSDELIKIVKRPLSFKTMPKFLIEELENKTTLELSHFNSFYEIPEIQKGIPVPSYIKQGNFVASSTSLGIFILSPDLKNVLHHLSVSSSIRNNIHDVQVLENGRILVFVNLEAKKMFDTKNSAIQELDSKTGKVLFTFTATPKSMFYSIYCGGVQKISEDLLFISHINNGVFVYSRSKKEIVYHSLHLHQKDGFLTSFQQAKLMDLEDFLTHWGVKSKFTLNI